MGRSPADPDNFAELVEIERASAKLHGRDPNQAEETVRRRLRDIAEKEKRERRFEEERNAQEAWRRRRPFVIAGGVVGGLALVVAAVFGVRWLIAKLERSEAFTKALDEASKPLDGLGLTPADEWADVEGETLELAVPERTCSALVGVVQGTTDPLPLVVRRPGGEARGGPLLWCSCAPESVTVSFAGPPAGHLALRWLSGPIDQVGGSQALAEQVRGAGDVQRLPADEACAYAAAAAWVTKPGRAEPVPFPEEVAKNRKFVADGVEPVGVFEPERSFVAIRSDADSCHFVQPFGEVGTVTLRDARGEPIGEPADKALGWCNYGEATTLTLWRNAGSEAPFAVTRALAMRMGGLTGLRELAARHGHEGASFVVVGDDLGRDARAAMVASSIIPATIEEASATGLPGNAGHKIIATALRREASLAPENDAIDVACAPEAEIDVAVTTKLCVQAEAQKWRAGGAAGSWGAVEADLPVWLWELAESPTRERLRAMASILAFARRMHLAGFEPTSMDGVESTPWGAKVSPRGKAKEVVALGITTKAPWFHPLSDGESWSLDGEPEVIAMPDEGQLTLKADHMLGFDPASRSAVVWRR